MLSTLIRTFVLPVIGLMLAFTTGAVPQTAQTPKHRAVFQMSEPEGEWSPLIAHVLNLQAALEKDGGVEIEIVCFGPGLDMLRASNTKFATVLKNLSGRGVILAACQNSTRDRPFATQVDSGVAELVRKQEAGWGYIR